MTSGVYQILNLQNGHRYVGSSSNLKERRRSHFYDLSRGCHHSRYLQSAYNKYGEDSFEFRLVLICEDFELLRYEQALMDSYLPEYNILPVAGSPLGHIVTEETREKLRRANIGHIATEESREKSRQSSLGRYVSDETRAKHRLYHPSEESNEKRRQAHLGIRRVGPLTSDEHYRRQQSQLGRKHSEETKEKIRQAHLGKYSDETLSKLRKTLDEGRMRKQEVQ